MEIDSGHRIAQRLPTYTPAPRLLRRVSVSAGRQYPGVVQPASTLASTVTGFVSPFGPTPGGSDRGRSGADRRRARRCPRRVQPHRLGHTWRVWERWCTARGISALPATPCAGSPTWSNAPQTERGVGHRHGLHRHPHMHRSHGPADPARTKASARSASGCAAPGHRPPPAGPAARTAEIRQIVTPSTAPRQGRPRRRDHPPRVRLSDAGLRARRPRPRRRRAQARRAAPARPPIEDRPRRHGQLVGVAHGNTPSPTPSPRSPPGLRIRGHPPGPLFTGLLHQVLTRTDLRGSRSPDAPRPGTRRRHDGPPDHRPLAARRTRNHRSAAGVPLHRIAVQTRHKGSPSSSTATSARPGTGRHLQPRPRPVKGPRRPEHHDSADAPNRRPGR